MQHEPSLDRYLTRQRNWQYIMLGILALGLIAAALGFRFFDTPDAGVPTFIEGKSQAQAKVTESFSIVAFVQGNQPPSALAADKAWAASLVTDIGIDLCDHNRALEAGLPANAEIMLARCGTTIDVSDLLVISRATGEKHLVVVEFPTDGSRWKVHGFGHAFEANPPSAPQPIERSWPPDKVMRWLVHDVADMVNTLCGYRIDCERVLARDDRSARMLAEMKSLLAKQQYPQAFALLNDIQVYDPDCEMALWRYVYERGLPESGNDPRFDETADMLEAYLARGGKGRRLSALYASFLACEGVGAERRERGRQLAEQLHARDPLDMSAWHALIRHQTNDGIARARLGIERYPLDGRFHAALCLQLLVSPFDSVEAIAAGEEAKKLRPWNNEVLINLGLARMVQANAMRENQQWSREQAQTAFDTAAAEIVQAWQRNPNHIEIWIDLLLRALTFDTRRLPPKSHLERRAFIFQFACMANGIAPSHYSDKVLKLFAEDERARLQAELEAKIEAAGKATLDDEVLLLCDVALRWRELRAAADGEASDRALRALAASVRRYRAHGGRNREIETLWNSRLSGLAE